MELESVPGSRASVPDREEQKEGPFVSKLVLESVVVCPRCGFPKAETMPTDACQFFYKCTSCGALLRPSKGDCCVFCSFGSVKCPPKQADESCCP